MPVFQTLQEFKKKRASKKLQAAPFYRKYPYRGKLPLSSADSRGLVDFDLGIFFNRIRKAGNTTIVTNLAELRFGGRLPGTDAKHAFPSPASLTEPDVGRFADLFKFVFVRNPYTRTLSAYLDKIAQGKRKPAGLAAGPGTVPAFADFCRYLSEGGLHENGHWAPQDDLLLIPVDHFDFIGKLENFDNDFDYVLGRIHGNGADGRRHEVRVSRANQTNANRRMREYYTAQTAETVARLFEADFKAFGYAMEPDFF